MYDLAIGKVNNHHLLSVCRSDLYLNIFSNIDQLPCDSELQVTVDSIVYNGNGSRVGHV